MAKYNLTDAPPPDRRVPDPITGVKSVPQERPGRIEYLYLTKDQRAKEEELDRAISDMPSFTRIRCRTPEERTSNGTSVIHYPHTDYDERTPPSEEEADLMCKTKGVRCPVRDQCLAFAMALEPDTGVWGGVVFVDGEPVPPKNRKN